MNELPPTYKVDVMTDRCDLNLVGKDICEAMSRMECGLTEHQEAVLRSLIYDHLDGIEERGLADYLRHLQDQRAMSRTAHESFRQEIEFIVGKAKKP